MAKLTQKEIINQQSKSINVIINRLVEIELLLSSVTDLITEKGVIDKNDLEVIIKQKVEIISQRTKWYKETTQFDEFEYFPYFGKPGEA